MRRALTMVEMLTALLLLSVIVAASASWTSLAARIGVARDGNEQPVIAAVFARIHDDLVTGDFDVQDDPPTLEDSRVRVTEGALEIDTRAGITSIYRFNRSQRVLERVVHGRGESKLRSLMSGIDEFTCAVDDEQHTLTVQLKLNQEGEAEHTRRYALP